MSVSCGAAFIVTMLPTFEKKENRKWRGIIFVIEGLTVLIPTGIMLNNFNEREMLN